MFVTLEGIDRAGKTTQARMLAEALGVDTVLLREPGGTDLGEGLRDLLKDPDVEFGARAELLMFCAARAELVDRVIEPALAAGRSVVCDRFTDSTVAYQGAGRGLGVELCEAASAVATAGREPDLTILLRLDPELAVARGHGRLAVGEDDGDDRFEVEGLDFQRRVAAAYDELAERHPQRIVVVEAEGSPDAVHARLIDAVRAAR